MHVKSKQPIKQYEAEDGENLFYYTDFFALSNMLENHELWLCNVLTMNDKTELRDYFNRLENRVMSNEKYRNFTEKWKTYRREIDEIIEKSSPYAMCFSKNEDDAAMWERYAQNGQGVCLAFNVPYLRCLVSKCNGFLKEISYELNSLDDVLDAIFEDIDLDPNKDEEKGQWLMNHLEPFLKSVCVKNCGFKSESEVRFFRLGIMENTFEKLDFDIKPNRIRQVLKVQIDKICDSLKISTYDFFTKLIEKIIIGPKSFQVANDLKIYLAEKQYNQLSTKVVFSNCTLR